MTLQNILYSYIISRILNLDEGMIYDIQQLGVDMVEKIIYHEQSKSRVVSSIISCDYSDLTFMDYGLSEPLFNKYEQLTENKKMEIVKYTYLSGCLNSDDKYKITNDIALYAAKNHDINIVKWLISQDTKGEYNYFVDFAAIYGNLDFIIWTTTRTFSDPIDYNYILQCAAFGGHINILEWGISTGLIPNVEICNSAAMNGRINVIQWCIYHNVRPNDKTFIEAICYSQLETLIWLYKNGYRWDHTKNDMYCFVQSIEVFEWLYSVKCPWDPFTILHFANYPTILLLAYEHGFLIDYNDELPMRFVEYGNIELLEWSRNVGCKFTSRVSVAAVENHKLDIIKWLHYNNCLYVDESLTEMRYILERDHMCVDYDTVKEINKFLIEIKQSA